jgi:hypothetical protein
LGSQVAFSFSGYRHLGTGTHFSGKRVNQELTDNQC